MSDESSQPSSESLRALLDPREAMTVAVRVQLSPSIVDTRIVAATRHAAALYGYEDPAELEGKFTSMVHVLEDIQRTRLRSTLRALGLVAPLERYEVRIIQQSGVAKRVVKDVEQRQMDDMMVWICRLESADLRVPFQPPAIPETLPEAALRDFFGWACVAEVEALIRQQPFLLTNIQNVTIFSQSTEETPGRTVPAMRTTGQHPIERLALKSPSPYYVCHCLVCDREWIKMGKEGADAALTPPGRCNYPDCRAYAWNDPVAAPAARRKREQRRARRQ